MVDREFINLQQALAGEYSLERELGRGGMGIVYLAREVQLDRLVAIKVLPESLAALPEVRERFVREARLAASLSHPHIVPIYRVGEAKGCVFFVMAYVNGETLGDRLRSRGPLSASAATRLLREVTWALSYAHGRGIVHRDIKPDNILIEAETGRALVSDFGIARRATEIQLASDPARVMGTAEFMSPEQAAGEPLDGRSDLYSLGVVGHLALSGALPSGSEASAATPAAVPRGLAGVLERCLRANPAERFATGEELAEALEGALSPERAKLPMPLRIWAQAQDPLAPVYAWWSASWTMMLIAEAPRVVRFPALALVPLLSLVPLTIFHARKTYHALAAGYSTRDLRAALATWQRERREELTFELDQAESRWARALRVLTYASAAGVVYAFVHGVPHSPLSTIVILASLAGSVGGFVLSHALGVPLVSRGIRTKLVGAVRSLIWNGRVGEWAAKVLTPTTRTHIADLDYGPTEFALGVAVEELFATLPAAYRENLSDLPGIVERLESHAVAARARVSELNEVLSLAHDPSLAAEAHDLARARDAAKRELADSVAALEAVRVDLLRLHGGAADLRPITSALAAAQALSEHLGRLAQARDEVEEISPAFPIDLRPHTPV